MTVTAMQSGIAAKIDAKMQTLIRAGHDDSTIFVEMADFMPDFKRLIDMSVQSAMDELAARYTGFYRYGKVLEGVAKGIQSGAIKVPKY